MQGSYKCFRNDYPFALIMSNSELSFSIFTLTDSPTPLILVFSPSFRILSSLSLIRPNRLSIRLAYKKAGCSFFNASSKEYLSGLIPYLLSPKYWLHFLQMELIGRFFLPPIASGNICSRLLFSESVFRSHHKQIDSSFVSVAVSSHQYWFMVFLLSDNTYYSFILILVIKSFLFPSQIFRQ
jgi:hypothetical protein